MNKKKGQGSLYMSPNKEETKKKKKGKKRLLEIIKVKARAQIKNRNTLIFIGSRIRYGIFWKRIDPLWKHGRRKGEKTGQTDSYNIILKENDLLSIFTQNVRSTQRRKGEKSKSKWNKKDKTKKNLIQKEIQESEMSAVFYISRQKR